MCEYSPNGPSGYSSANVQLDSCRHDQVVNMLLPSAPRGLPGHYERSKVTAIDKSPMGQSYLRSEN